jgi:ABC-2 type transport system ATP-binding protein
MPAITTETVASLSNVTKRYANGVTALDGLSLDLRCGEIVALLGLSAPTSGTARIFGADPRNPTARLRTGVMLQVGRAPEMLRVREHINIFRGYYPNPMPYEDLIKAAGLGEIQERFFGQLSGGQKQRVLFAIALAGDPDLVFLDEPTVGLDIESRRGMWSQIRLLAARGKTVLLTTHYLEEADALANRIIVINRGKVVCEGTPAEVKSMGAATTGQHSPSGRNVKIIRCATTLTADHLQAMAGVLGVVTAGSLTELTTEQPEATLREMLALDQTLSALEVESPALEDAFLALTTHN